MGTMNTFSYPLGYKTNHFRQSRRLLLATSQAAGPDGKGIGEEVEKLEKVTVYYTEEAGHKVAHFFKKAF